MPFSSGVNRAFLMGRVEDEPAWETIGNQHFLCFRLSTTENIKKDGQPHKLVEWHIIRIPSGPLTNDYDLKAGDLVSVQGRIQTHIVFENNVKLYKTEILVAGLEKLEFSNELSHSA